MRDCEIETRTLAEQPTAVRRATLRVPEIGPWLGTVYAEVAGVLAAAGAGPAGPPFARYHRLGEDRFEVEAGFPATGPIEGTQTVQASSLPAGPAAATTYVGPYEEMEPVWAAIWAWMAEQGVDPACDPWEVYLSDPASQPDPATWRTDVVAPFRPR